MADIVRLGDTDVDIAWRVNDGVCEAGYYSRDGLEPCTPCPRGFYQSGRQSTTCAECSSDFTTSSVASTSSTECVDGAPVLCDQFKCLNGGTCQVSGHDYYCVCREGYSGRNCDFYISPCASQPCYNQAICTPTGTPHLHLSMSQ
ncbi:hypothetical protein RRG08_061177 [Elysia crispata]|uniref:EGF-like domain-containing protein n=1 Tax=Elysia crispata TaxID=231223 RepID=A0AAE0XDV5_9GAST|nr:hypothetical protein RRG08_061177 [Elysia crispata]